MKVVLIYIAVLLSLGQASSCSKKVVAPPSDCLDTPKGDCACVQIYKPVCGCDGKTYANDCAAQCAGVKRWTEGACPNK